MSLADSEWCVVVSVRQYRNGLCLVLFETRITVGLQGLPGMLPSTVVDGCMDRVLVDFPVSGRCTRGFFPDPVSEEDARVSASVPLVCCMPRPKFVPQLAGASPRCMVVERRYMCVCLCQQAVELRVPV